MGAATQLGVRGPAAKRIVTSNGDTYLIMERIDGVTLEDVWPELGWFTTIKIALKLRWFVRLLRSLTSLTAGSLVSGECSSFYLEDHFMLPPKSGPAVITSFIEFWTSFTSIRQAMKPVIREAVPPTTFIPATANTLVFTHHDLAPRNLLLDRVGQLWVLDWEYAGWYPKYFEYAAMQNFPVPQVWTRFARARWFLFTWITVGRFDQERNVLELIRTKFTRFMFGRRFEILANGIPAGRHVSRVKTYLEMETHSASLNIEGAKTYFVYNVFCIQDAEFLCKKLSDFARQCSPKHQERDKFIPSRVEFMHLLQAPTKLLSTNSQTF